MPFEPPRPRRPLRRIAAALALAALCTPAPAGPRVRVGVYENPPLVFRSDDGTYQGFCVDILREAASRNGWELAFVPGTWAECLSRLARGEIDLQTAIAYSADRARRFSFNRETLLTNWGWIYTRAGSGIDSLLDLRGRSVAVLPGDIHTRSLQDLARRFEIPCRWVEVDDYPAVFQWIQEGRVDAGLVNRLAALRLERDYTVERTSIVFNPIEVRFAAPPGREKALLAALDRTLASLKSDPGSAYHQALKTWFTPPAPPPGRLPGWLRRAAAVGAGVIALLALATAVTRRQVRVRTRELDRFKRELRAEIARRERVAKALHASERRYRNVVEHAADALFVLDQDGRIVDVNRRACDSLGRSRDELLAMTVAELSSLFGTEDIRRFVGRVLEHGSVAVRDVHRRKDGSEFPVEVRATRIDPDAGLFLAIARDVTEQEHLERTIRLAHNHLRATLDALPDFLFELDGTGRILGFHAPDPNELYRPPEEFLGKPVSEVIPPAAAGVVLDALATAAVAGRHLGATYSLPQPDGERWFELSVSAEVGDRDDGAEPDRFVALVRDVTDRRRLEDQLRRAQKMEAVGVLASGIAHDFNNLLQIISGSVEALGRPGLTDGERRDRAAVVETTVERGAGLVRQLLAFARPRSASRTVFELGREVERVCQILRRTLPKMIRVENRSGARAVHVCADPNQVEQVLFNLATNARDAMPGGGTLSIETGIDPDTGRAFLAVADTGVGIAPEALDRIFEPFYTTKPMGHGTGLGLATAYGIVRENGGEIVCHSEPGRGARFTVYLPASGRPDDPDEPTTTPTAPPAGAPRGGTVLVVDDEAVVRDLARQALEDAGYRVLTAASGEEALEVYRSQGWEVDAVILDLGMPGMGGKACLKALLEQDPAARVLVSTGYASDDEAREVEQLGAAGFVAKPYRLSDLLARVARALSAG